VIFRQKHESQNDNGNAADARILGLVPHVKEDNANYRKMLDDVQD
jgi:hypothetical protein